MQLRRNIDNADTNANIARGAQHAKEVEGRERRRTGKGPCRWEEGSGADLWVCLVPVEREKSELIYRRPSGLCLRLRGDLDQTPETFIT